ncbi:MAG: epoxyqueuosine reductase [Myxococcota bacterium]|jgi:epoxyqueuosine reductase
MPDEHWKDLVASLTEMLARSGLDLVVPGQVGAYNATVDASYRLPDFGAPSSLVVLVGNTRAMWPHFCAELAANPARTHHRHPLDSWLVERIQAAVAETALTPEVRYAPEPPPRRVAIQRLAELVGLAQLAPCHLGVHPAHGPWVSLRAALVFNQVGPATTMLDPGPCDTCVARPCLPALEKALTTPSDWRGWLTMRDACPVGQTARFSEAQIRYHYTHALPTP